MTKRDTTTKGSTAGKAEGSSTTATVGCEQAQRIAAFIIWKTEGDATAARALAHLIHLIYREEDKLEREMLANSAKRGAYISSEDFADGLSEFMAEADSREPELKFDNGEAFAPIY